MTSTPAGWYDDPDPAAPPHSLRWWDGSQWTGHVQARGGPPVSTGPITPDGQPLAGWWWRVLAVVVDTILVLIPGLAVSAPAQVEMQRALLERQRELFDQGRVPPGQQPGMDELYAPIFDAYLEHAVVLLVLPILIVLVYHVGFLCWRGATPGKLVCGLRVRPRAHDGRVRWPVALVRVLVVFGPGWTVLVVAVATGSFALLLLAQLGVVALYAVDALVALGRRRQTIHDRVAGTVVVATR